MIADQNNYDALDNTTNGTAFVEQDVATEIEFNTTIDVSSICEREREILDVRERESEGNIPHHRRVWITNGTQAQRSGCSAFARKRSRRAFARNERNGGGGAVCRRGSLVHVKRRARGTDERRVLCSPRRSAIH